MFVSSVLNIRITRKKPQISRALNKIYFQVGLVAGNVFGVYLAQTYEVKNIKTFYPSFKPLKNVQGPRLTLLASLTDSIPHGSNFIKSFNYTFPICTQKVLCCLFGEGAYVREVIINIFFTIKLKTL